MGFVGGLHRSGTTLTANLIGTAGAALLRGTGVDEDEGHHLHDVTESAISFGGPGRFAFADEMQLPPSRRPELDRVRMLEAWEPYWSDVSLPARLEKSPQHLVQTRFLSSVFPDSPILIVMRHPVTVALATQKWTRPGPPALRRALPATSIERLVDHWIVAHRRLAEDMKVIGSRGSVEVVRYEDLVVDPVAALEPFCARLGVGSIDPSAFVLRPSCYAERWRRWRSGPVGRLAGRAWLDRADEAMSFWGYSIDDDLV